MRSARVATALRGIMQARASGRLNIIMNVTPQILNLPHDRSIDAKVTHVSPTGETTLHTQDGEIKIITSRKLQEGQDFKLCTQKENGTVQITLKATDGREDILLKMPGDFKKMLAENTEQTQVPKANYNRYQSSYTQYQKPTNLPNTSLFSFLTYLDKKSVANELESGGAKGIVPDIESSDFLKKIARLTNPENKLYENFGDLEYVHNLKAANKSLSTDEWKFFCIPFKYKDQLNQMKLIIEDRESAEYDFESPRKFWIEINPENLGRIQIDGTYSHVKGNTKTSLNLSSEKNMSDNIKKEIEGFAGGLGAKLSINLNLNFVDYVSSRDDAFQVLLENYCRNRVSEVYV